jgi:hypothetical protein
MAIERSNRGMLPRLRGVEIKPADEELVLLLAEQFYPRLTHLDQIENPQERRGWTILAVQILLGQETIMRYVEKFSAIFKPSVDAQVDETVRRSAAEEQERAERKEREIERHKAELFRIAEEESLDGERWEMEKKEREKKLELEVKEREKRLELEEEERTAHLRLETEEREAAHKNRVRREQLAYWMAAVAFACAAVALVVGIVRGEPVIIGSSSAIAIGALVALVSLMLAERSRPSLPMPSSTQASGGAPAGPNG